MCDFWETVLFGAGTYRGSALRVHQRVRSQHPFGAEHFDRTRGIAEELRRSGLADTPLSVLSRGLAGIVDPDGMLVVNLPGSPRAVASGVPVVLGVAAHILDQVKGGDHS